MCGFDNIKFLLIFLVVFAHLLELFERFPLHGVIYFIIYCFHMPAFIFFSGLFCGKRPQIAKFLIIYILFQTFYLVMLWIMNGRSYPLTLQFTTPSWNLWFLLALIVYWTIAPFIMDSPLKKQIVLLLGSVCIALLAGLDDTIGGMLSLSRIIVFTPFFILGCMLNPNKSQLQARIKSIGKKRWIIVCVGFVFLAALAVFLYWKRIVSATMLFGSHSYSSPPYNMAIRLLQFFMAAMWIGWLLVLQSLIDFSIPMVTGIGRNTLWIYLLHALIIQYIKRQELSDCNRIESIVIVISVTILILVMFGNPIVGSFMKRVFFLSAQRVPKDRRK